MLNLSILLEDSARKYPDRDALVPGPTRPTYRQVDAAANQVANLLVERGIEPGDKVALMCPNLPYFSIVYYGILKAGAVVVPLNVLLKGCEVAYHLEPGSSLTTDVLVAWAKEQMAAYKHPRIVDFVASLPMTATGKILKREQVDRSTTSSGT